jgi:glycerol kinase
VGFYDSLEQVANTWHEERRFEPQATRRWVSDKLRSWQKAVTCA